MKIRVKRRSKKNSPKIKRVEVICRAPNIWYLRVTHDLRHLLYARCMDDDKPNLLELHLDGDRYLSDVTEIHFKAENKQEQFLTKAQFCLCENERYLFTAYFLIMDSGRSKLSPKLIKQWGR